MNMSEGEGILVKWMRRKLKEKVKRRGWGTRFNLTSTKVVTGWSGLRIGTGGGHL
jgi:hypothetical protein